MRDPSALGEWLLRLSSGSTLPMSQVYDRDAWLLERLPAWQGDGLMSNDPTQHHRNTQTPAPGGKE